MIVGGEPTFGKGTVQQFRNLDQFTNYPEMRPLGEMKVTIQKILSCKWWFSAT